MVDKPFNFKYVHHICDNVYGINIQWGYAGIFNVGIMGFTALGGLAAVLVSYSPVGEAWRVGGIGMIISLFLLIITIVVVFFSTEFFEIVLTSIGSLV